VGNNFRKTYLRVSIDFTLTASQVHIGVANILRIEYEDDLGLAGNAEFDFVGVD
jgi:hypothetical protein